MFNVCSIREGELLLKAGFDIIGWTPLVRTNSISREEAQGRKGYPVGREVAEAARYSCHSPNVLINNLFVTPADLEAAADTGNRTLQIFASYR